MPCRDWEGVSNSVSEEAYETVRADLSRTKRRLDAATRVACEIEKLLTDEERASLSDESFKWVKEHREADAKQQREDEARRRRDEEEKSRKAKMERERKAALNKLSKEERRVLGLPDPA